MKKVVYLFKRIIGMNFKNFFKTIGKISRENKRSKTLLFFDCIWCGIRHQAGYIDYDFYNMYNLTGKERKTIMTRGRNNHYVSYLNPKEYWHYFDNKNEFNEKFSKYLNRDWMYLNSDNYKDFCKFIEKHKTIIVKPNNLSCGKGVEKIDTTKLDSKELYDKLIANETYLIEEVAIQCAAISKLHPSSINTIRIVTLISDYGVPQVISAVIRMGTNNSGVDNFNNGGVCAMIDIKTGKIISDGINSSGKIFKKHPNSKITFNGFQIPMWNKICDTVLEASQVVKEMRLIGWDICLGKDNPSIIEANQFPAHDLYQPLFGKNDRIGMVPTFEKAIRKK